MFVVRSSTGRSIWRRHLWRSFLQHAMKSNAPGVAPLQIAGAHPWDANPGWFDTRLDRHGGRQGTLQAKAGRAASTLVQVMSRPALRSRHRQQRCRCRAGSGPHGFIESALRPCGVAVPDEDLQIPPKPVPSTCRVHDRKPGGDGPDALVTSAICDTDRRCIDGDQTTRDREPSARNVMTPVGESVSRTSATPVRAHPLLRSSHVNFRLLPRYL